jgi:lipopolysaccharide biosynthesis regulator YciM
MKRVLILITGFVFVFSSCSNHHPIAKASDYNSFLNEEIVKEQVKKVNEEIVFWQNRLKTDTGSFINMSEIANYQLSLFKATGNIVNLKTGDSLLKRSSEKLNNTNPELLFSLSQTCVTQHQFLQSAQYITSAEKAKGDLYTIRLLEFDTYMELGKFIEAYKSLESLKDKESFDYIIRKAKWEDHKGNLDKATILMEKAFEKVKYKNKNLYSWVLTNLSDMYGHAGRVQEAYNGYISVLKKDPANLYCLKGIAWIAYSHDNNTKEAKRILQFILSQTQMPDLKLILADIAETEGKNEEKQKLLQEFITAVTKPDYGDMYNKALINIYTDETGEYQKAQTIAKRELNNRFTPETCDWMAWVYYKKGDKKKALEIAKGYVNRMTFEPDAIMHTAYIYAANGKKNEAKQMLEECLQSSFEIGPLATKQVIEKLQSL